MAEQGSWGGGASDAFVDPPHPENGYSAHFLETVQGSVLAAPWHLLPKLPIINLDVGVVGGGGAAVAGMCESSGGLGLTACGETQLCGGFYRQYGAVL